MRRWEEGSLQRQLRAAHFDADGKQDILTSSRSQTITKCRSAGSAGLVVAAAATVAAAAACCCSVRCRLAEFCIESKAIVARSWAPLSGQQRSARAKNLTFASNCD